MQLVVHVRGLGENVGEMRCVLNTFADQDKVAARIARAVRNWIRVVPVRHNGSKLDLVVTAEWLEDKHVPVPDGTGPPVFVRQLKRKPARRKKGK